MDEKVKKILETDFILDNNGPDKVIPLSKSIKAHITSGQKVHMGMGANAAVREIIRTFHGTGLKFDLITEFMFFSHLDLIHCNLVKKLITAGVGETRKLSPSKTLNRAIKNGTLELESYSLASFIQRLMAGAMAGFMPTVSLMGSTMAKLHTHAFKTIDHPFEPGKKAGVIKGLNPDISIVHAWAADQSGNAIVLPHHFTAEETWGAWASRGGVIITTEKIVSTDFIRKYNTLVNIPQYMVKSVSLAPLGSHPEGIMNWGFTDFDAYEYDWDFINDRQKTLDKDRLDQWIKEWVFDCSDTREYLDKLGSERISSLRGRAHPEYWKINAYEKGKNISSSKKYTPREKMVVMASRKILERVLKKDYKTILSGGGVASMSAWLGHRELRKHGNFAEIVVGSGQFGFTPLPGDPFIANFTSLSTCKMITNGINCYQALIGGNNKKSISILGGAQIDKSGNINSAIVSTPQGDIYLTGAGGGGDACKASEVLVVMEQTKNRFVEKVPYITSSGETIKTVVSTLGIFEKDENNELILTACFHNPMAYDIKENIEFIKENCGWDLKVSPGIIKLPEPEIEELIRLRLIDPEGEHTS